MWSEAAALLVLLAATSPYAAVVTGYGMLYLGEHSASIGGCTLADGALADLWIGDSAIAAYLSSNNLSLIHANSTGVYTASYEPADLIGLGEGGRVIRRVDGGVDIAGEVSVYVAGACPHPLSAKLGGGELGVSCGDSLLYYRLGESTASLLRTNNVSAVLSVGNGTVLVRLGDGVGFVDFTHHVALTTACEPIMWGAGQEGVWVVCDGEPVEVLLYGGGGLEYAEVRSPYMVCSSAGVPCMITAGSPYIEGLSFRPVEGRVSSEGIQVTRVGVTIGESVSSPPDYTHVPGDCLTGSSPSFVASGEPVPSRLLAGTAMIVGGLISVLLGYRLSRQESISGKG